MGALTSRTWRAGHVVDHDVTRDELAAAVADTDTLLWVDLVDPTEGDVGGIARELRLPFTAVEDVLAPHERPKLIRHESFLFFTVYAWAEGRPSRISGWVLPYALVTIRLDDLVDIDAIRRRWEEDPTLLAHGAPALVHGLLD